LNDDQIHIEQVFEYVRTPVLFNLAAGYKELTNEQAIMTGHYLCGSGLLILLPTSSPDSRSILVKIG
jgi:hypothetical protein